MTPASRTVRPHSGHLLLHEYIYHSTMFGLFSAAFLIRAGFAIRLFDLIMLSNLVLMFRLINLARVPAWTLWLITYLALSGVIGIAAGTDSFPLFVKEFLGISASLLYFYYFFKLIENDYRQAFSTYARISFWFAILGIPLCIGASISSGGYERLHSLASEPAAFCELVLPAYYWYGYQYFRSRKHGKEVLGFTLAFILTGSSLGFLSVAFGVLLLLSTRLKHILLAPIIVASLMAIAYSTSPFFRVRLDDTLLAISGDSVSGVNLSTYAVISNVFVTQQVLRESPLIGNGLGSHPISHARFIGDIPGIEAFQNSGQADLNAPDAASLTLRVLSELGLIGFLGVLAFVLHFRVGGDSVYAAISSAILTSFFLKLLRGGLYFRPEQFFFVSVYLLNSRKFRALIGRRRTPSLEPEMRHASRSTA